MPEGSARNPHGDFKAIEAARPRFDEASRFRFTQTVDPAWAPGDGANRLGRGRDGELATRFEHVAVDPHAPGRAAALNYKLLISGVVPRPIAFVSTRSGDGATTNLAPFSYFNLINHDPQLFVVGIASPAAADAGAKDTLRNLVASREAVLNIISESFVEAANATSIDAPYGCSEWPLSGLTPSTTATPSAVPVSPRPSLASRSSLTWSKNTIAGPAPAPSREPWSSSRARASGSVATPSTMTVASSIPPP